MKKTIDRVAVALLTGALPVAAATFPLEWNATYDTSVPREVEILPAKLVGMGLMRAGDGFKVLADGQPLAVKALDGKEPGSVRLRFTVPSGTKSLTCETGPDGAKAEASDGGLFAGALAGTTGWLFKGGTVEKTEKGILLKGEKERTPGRPAPEIRNSGRACRDRQRAKPLISARFAFTISSQRSR